MALQDMCGSLGLRQCQMGALGRLGLKSGFEKPRTEAWLPIFLRPLSHWHQTRECLKGHVGPYSTASDNAGSSGWRTLRELNQGLTLSSCSGSVSSGPGDWAFTPVFRAYFFVCEMEGNEILSVFIEPIFLTFWTMCQSLFWAFGIHQRRGKISLPFGHFFFL